MLPTGRVEILVSPEPWKPRPDRKRRSRLVAEHRRRQGDPTSGGSTRRPIMTAYRQQALACALTRGTDELVVIANSTAMLDLREHVAEQGFAARYWA